MNNFDDEYIKISNKLDLGKEMLYLSYSDCEKFCPNSDEILKIVEASFSAHGKKQCEMPPKQGVHIEESFFHAMPALVPSLYAGGIKWISSYPNNIKDYSLPQISGLQILSDLQTGQPICVMDSRYLTVMRTAAATAVATKYIHPNAQIFGMFGCGVQGIGHIRFMKQALKNLKKAVVYDIDIKKAENLKLELQDLNIDIEVVDNPKEVVKKAELMCSATIITRKNLAVVKKDWIREGQTLMACDLNTFWDEDIPFICDKYIVDSVSQHEYLEKDGYFDKGLAKIYCETGEIIAGVKKARENNNEIVLCSNIGLAVHDVTLGKHIFDNALKNNGGKILDL